MGGGLGLSMHGSHRVITDNAQAAMPEMAIGFCPDVGASWKFSRMKSKNFGPSIAMAVFLCTTGWRMTAADMLYTGLATDYVAAGDIQSFIDMVIAESLDEALEFYAEPRPINSKLKEFHEDIEATFAFDSWAEIEQALDSHENKDFVEHVRELLKPANPTSLVAAVELIHANAEVPDIRRALDNEYTVGATLRRQKNFAEGVRAVLVDKDRNPSFDPATVDDIDTMVYRRLLNGSEI